MNENTKWRHIDAFNKIELAVYHLAEHPEDIRSRLYSVYYCHLVKLTADDFPDELDIKNTFQWVISQLTSKEAPEIIKGDIRQDKVKWSLYRRRKSDLKEIASAITTIHCKLESLLNE